MATTQIALFIDFRFEGPYIGQMKSVISHLAPDILVIDLMHNVPARDMVSVMYLFAALFHYFPAGTVFVAVADSGVGSNDREPIAVKANRRWLVSRTDCSQAWSV